MWAKHLLPGSTGLDGAVGWGADVAGFLEVDLVGERVEEAVFGRFLGLLRCCWGNDTFVVTGNFV